MSVLQKKITGGGISQARKITAAQAGKAQELLKSIELGFGDFSDTLENRDLRKALTTLRDGTEGLKAGKVWLDVVKVYVKSSEDALKAYDEASDEFAGTPKEQLAKDLLGVIKGSIASLEDSLVEDE